MLQTTALLCTNFIRHLDPRVLWLLTKIQLKRTSFVFPTKSSTKTALFRNFVTKLSKHLSNLMLYSTNPQTNLRHRSTLSEEWDHQVWCEFNHVWGTNHLFKDNRFSTINSGQMSRSSFSLHNIVLWDIAFVVTKESLPS